MLWKAMRVGAALKAVSIDAGANVLMPYFEFSSSMVSSSFDAALLAFERVEEVERMQAIGNEAVETERR